ncbi:hypothetical protein AB0B57_22400 [Micromonospora sp. NPDC049101]|uniref:hypothetical protein n=1 Tax=Micromonospora sp. NPDC049101 TaxID=3155032 RepID=UPI00340A82C0
MTLEEFTQQKIDAYRAEVAEDVEAGRVPFAGKIMANLLQALLDEYRAKYGNGS